MWDRNTRSRPPPEGGQTRPWPSRGGYQKLAEHKYDDVALQRAKELRQSSTEAERKLWAHLRGKKLDGYKFRRQHPIGAFIADFFCPAAKLVIEIDGSQHNEAENAAYDAERTAFLKNAGYRVLRFWNNEVMKNIEGVVTQIAEMISTPPDSAKAESAPPQGGGGSVLLLLLTFFAFFFLADASLAQSVSLDMGKAGEGGSAARLIQLLVLITVISLAPSLLVMMTSFVRIIIVLSLIRSAIGLQQTPPNQVLISLALFLTFFIMQPVFEKAYDEGLKPLMEESISTEQALENAGAPFHAFMLKHVRANDLELFMNMAKIEKVEAPEDTPFRVLIPAFMISELKRGFEIGFLIYLPFVVIDMLIASILMAMGMMMLPPVTISLPFKLIFFVLVDGWYLVCGSLVKSFGAL